jgi:aminodeoxyfutalosine deaminase
VETIFSSRWIFPISSSPIESGFVRLHANGEVVELGKGRPRGAIDLGDVAILPSLVNAHTHLDLSHFETPLGHAGMPLARWIGLVIQSRLQSTSSDVAKVITQGIIESRRYSVGLIGDIATPPDFAVNPPMDSLEPFPQIVSFAEVVGLSPDRFASRIDAADRMLASDPEGGISPHAPYSLSLRSIGETIRVARTLGRAIQMHVAESTCERELIFQGRGQFRETLQSIGVWRDDLFPWPQQDFCDLIRSLATATRASLVHGNDLQPAEIDQLAKHPNLSVIYCPRTHAYFDHDPHPIISLMDAGVRVALGTDSRASSPDLNLWSEVRHLLHHRQDVAPEMVLRCATIHGADALGQHKMGRIEIGYRPGLVTIPTNAASMERFWEDCAGADHPRLIPTCNPSAA